MIKFDYEKMEIICPDGYVITSTLIDPIEWSWHSVEYRLDRIV